MFECTRSFYLKFFILINISVLITSCSVYRSGGRKNLESSAEQNLSIQDFNPIQCDEINQVSFWYETRFSSPHSQWIESLPHLEVWLDTLDGEQIQIRTYEKHQDQPQQIDNITRCLSTFSSFSEWRKYRSFYIKSLEGEQL